MSALVDFANWVKTAGPVAGGGTPLAAPPPGSAFTSPDPAAPGGGSGGAAQAGSMAGEDGALPATETEFFFEKGKSDLTKDAKEWIEKYARAYLAADDSE